VQLTERFEINAGLRYENNDAFSRLANIQTPYPQPPQYPQQPSQYPQPQQPSQYPYQQPQQYPQQPYQQQPPYQQWPVQQQPGRGSGMSSVGKVLIISAVGVVALAIIAAVLLTGKSTSANNASTTVVVAQSTSAATTTDGEPSAEPSLSQGPERAECVTASSVSSEPIGYHACGTASRNVGVPTYNAAEAKKSYTVTIKTNRGDIVFTADGKAAPYAVYSFVYLAEKQYFNATSCHRLTTNAIYVLQCGDPTGTGSGGPGYAFQDENLASLGTPDSEGSVTYKAGVVAMANAGPDTNGSQFFLVYKDSPIAPGYTPFGTITQGLNIIQQVAQAGTDNSNSAGDGHPNDSVQIASVTIQ